MIRIRIRMCSGNATLLVCVINIVSNSIFQTRYVMRVGSQTAEIGLKTIIELCFNNSKLGLFWMAMFGWEIPLERSVSVETQPH